MLLFTCEGKADSTPAAAFLEALAAGVFGIPSFSKSVVRYLGDDILLYKGGENYSCASAFA